jgi:hypothetical protein
MNLPLHIIFSVPYHFAALQLCFVFGRFLVYFLARGSARLTVMCEPLQTNAVPALRNVAQPHVDAT